MPRLSNSLPKYRKHRSSGQALVTLGGRDYYLGPHNTKASKLEYDRLVAEWLASGRSASFHASPSELSVAELLLAFLKYAQNYYGLDRKSQYHHYVRVARPLKQLYSGTAAAEFSPLQFKAVRQRLIDEGCSRPYVNACMSRVARIFRWGASESLVSAEVSQVLATIDGLRRGRTEAPETAPILPVDDEIVDATLEHLPQVVADLVRLQKLTGARPAEVCLVRPCDIDRSGEVWVYVPMQHKTEHHGKSREILIGPKAQAVLLRYLARDSEAFCFRPCDSEEKRRAEVHANRKTPLSYGNKPGSRQAKRGRRRPKKQPGDRYITDSYRRAIHRACDRAFPHPELSKLKRSELTSEQLAELKKWQSEHRWSPNRLRHSAGTLVRREFGLEAAQVILGHSSAAVTEIYAERDLSKGIEVAKRIG